MISISTVTPVYAGQEYLPQLVLELNQLRVQIETHSKKLVLAESIFVLDGAIDSSEQVIDKLSKTYPWIRVVTLSRNFGQHNATVAGILHCSGDWVVTLDEDLQHPPENILHMLFIAAEEHADVILATASHGTHGSGYRDLFSVTAKKLINWVSKSKFTASFSSFRLIRGEIARAAASVSSHQTYFDVALVWFTSRIIPYPLHLEDQRFLEKKSSGYSFFSLLSHLKRLIFSSDIQFFRFSMLISGASLLLAILVESWVLINFFFNPDVADVRGWASLMSVMFFYGGGISLLLGFTLEFVRTDMFNGQGKPTFFVVDRSSDNLLASELDYVLKPETQLEG
ncbi:MAG: glycosyltransferase involved in cell wall biosynthesis [Lysobacterales bacterium]|jgi:glycosyltransferase involved in cell wall biosynthesis